MSSIIYLNNGAIYYTPIEDQECGELIDTLLDLVGTEVHENGNIVHAGEELGCVMYVDETTCIKSKLEV